MAVDPSVRALLDRLEAEGRPAFRDLSPEEARALAREGMAADGGTPEQVASVEDVRIAGPLGDIPVRIYRPLAPTGCGLVYFHGGGWVVCDLDTHHVVCTALARRAGAVVVAVDYRLAPEHRFPAAVTDSYAVAKWVAERAHKLGIDPGRIAVGGDSAGGNLATVVCLKAREEGGPKFALQVLVYPVTDLSSFDTGSYGEFAEGHHLTRATMEWFREHYLGEQDGRDPYASPLLAGDLRGLPPALVLTAECDVLRDEGEAYARRLEAAGVPVRLIRYDGMIHPFFSLPRAIPRAFDAYDEVAAAVKNTRP